LLCLFCYEPIAQAGTSVSRKEYLSAMFVLGCAAAVAVVLQHAMVVVQHCYSDFAVESVIALPDTAVGQCLVVQLLVLLQWHWNCSMVAVVQHCRLAAAILSLFCCSWFLPGCASAAFSVEADMYGTVPILSTYWAMPLSCFTAAS
jgi:hypothetical protein